MAWIIAIIISIISLIIYYAFYSLISPFLKWFIDIAAKTPLLTDLVPISILNGIKTLSVLILLAFLAYGIVMTITGKTLGLQNELTPSQLFVRVSVAILIIAISYSLIDKMIELSNYLVSAIEIGNISYISVIKDLIYDYEKMLHDSGFGIKTLYYAEADLGLLIQFIVILLAFLFLIIMLVRFLVFWLKRIALICVFGSFFPIAAILYILPGTAQYAKLIFKKVILDIFVIFLVMLSIGLGSYIVGNEDLVADIFDKPAVLWLRIIFQLALFIAILMLSLKIPTILDSRVGVDLGAFAAWGVASGYLMSSVKWTKGKYDNYKVAKANSGGGSGGRIGDGGFGGRNSGGDNRGGGPTGGGVGGSSGGIHEINSNEYKGSLKNAPQNLFNKWYKNYSNGTGNVPSFFKEREKSYNISNQDPLKMAEYDKNYPEISRKLKIAHANYKKDRIMEEFEDKLSDEK